MTSRALIFDVDGVIFDSQPAKNASWTLALMRIISGTAAELLDALKRPDETKAVVGDLTALLQERYSSELDQVTRAAGLSRSDTRRYVWSLRGNYVGTSTEFDLENLRNEIKDVLILHATRAIEGTLDLIDAADGALPLALVTQAKRADVVAQAAALGISMKPFSAVECAGDYRVEDHVDAKALAYLEACRQLGADPSSSIAIEDADGGLVSARAAGLQCIGLRRQANRQSLRLARLVVPDLGLLAKPETIDVLASVHDLDDVFHHLEQSVPAVVVACAVGGRNVSTVEVHAGGETTETTECAWAQAMEGNDARHGIVRLIAEQIRRTVKDTFARTVGVSIKGPIRQVEADVFVGPWVVRPYDAPWPFEARLREALDAAGVAFGHVRVLLDSAAALLGEMHPRGTLAGQTSGIVFIWGTGIGCTIRESGEVLDDIAQDEPGDDRRRLYTSPGRHLVHGSAGYDWQPIPFGHPKAPLHDGEEWMSERLAGAWLPARVARYLSDLDAASRARTLDEMAVDFTQVELRGSTSSMEAKLLEGLTRAASRGNDWAFSQLAFIGAEFGAALAAFVWEFRTLRAVEHIVLVSSIGERLGKGVKGPGIEEDVLIDSIRQSLIAALGARGMEDARARVIASGVQRSRIGRERECLAFARQSKA